MTQPKFDADLIATSAQLSINESHIEGMIVHSVFEHQLESSVEDKLQLFCICYRKDIKIHKFPHPLME